MKNLLIVILIFPFLLSAQSQEYAVFESINIAPQTHKVKEFEAKLAAHNKKYHAQAPYSARVYSIVSGPNMGSYIWNMGPIPWSAMGARPSEGGHNDDWTDNVVSTLSEDAYGRYWKQEQELSHFPGDFTLSKLMIWYIDVERFAMPQMIELMKKVREVYAAKLPQETYGVYSNELSSTRDGKDLAIVWFFGDYAWMGEDLEFSKHYNEVHGAGSFEAFLKDFGANSKGVESELWEFRPDLSGIDGKVVVPQ